MFTDRTDNDVTPLSTEQVLKFLAKFPLASIVYLEWLTYTKLIQVRAYVTEESMTCNSLIITVY